MNPFRIYAPEECRSDGYPYAWRSIDGGRGVKHLVREAAEYRCLRCLHPYRAGGPDAMWSRCDGECRHGGPGRVLRGDVEQRFDDPPPGGLYLWMRAGLRVDAAWRILTVHHLNGVKADLRWWNLVALCQRCHLQIQGKVVMEQIYSWEHTPWFKPYAAGWYSYCYEGIERTRDEVMADLDRLLALERVA
jgi:5-methylcytosine-specific restriction endonuclease McrA